MPCKFENTSIEGVILVTPRRFSDSRGYFMETYKESEFFKNGIDVKFLQDNQSSSQKNVIRGLHFQNPPYAQGKLVRCLVGAIWDIVVDVRKGSPTYGRWLGYELSSKNYRMLYVPPGFAHGFATLSDTAEIAYKVTAEYNPQSEAGVIWNDPAVEIDWPIASPLLSEKDAIYPCLADADNQFTWDANG